MILLQRWAQGFVFFLVALLVLVAGSMCRVDAAQTGAPTRASPSNCDHVYIFIIQGFSPTDMAKLHQLQDYIHELGFHKTYYNAFYQRSQVDTEIRRIHAEDPEACFVLIGFSFGANAARSACQAVKGDGICIDLLVYLGGNTLRDIPEDQPENAAKIYNILAWGCIWNGHTMSRAENIQATDCWHFGSPMHPYTLDMLARELPLVAGHVCGPEIVAKPPRTPTVER
jgi:hypothetical protein